jgi:hypothetical protein
MKTFASVLMVMVLILTGSVGQSSADMDILDFISAITKKKNVVPENELIIQLAGIGYEVIDLGDFSLNFSTQAIWYASELNGGIPTFNGTLTQVGTSDEFTYSATPADKLVVVFNNGSSIEIITNASLFQGYTGGTWEDFLKSHDVDFHIYSKDVCDLRVTSVTTPVEINDPVYDQANQWNRNCLGDVWVTGKKVTINSNYAGDEKSYVSGDFVFYKLKDQITGTCNSDMGTINISEGFGADFSHQSSNNQETKSIVRLNNNTLATGGNDYQFNGFRVSWEYVSILPSNPAHVSQANIWEASGTLLKNGQFYGALKFDGPVVEGTSGPSVIIQFANGEVLNLFKPINLP